MGVGTWFRVVGVDVSVVGFDDDAVIAVDDDDVAAVDVVLTAKVLVVS